jgi:hypothetical protein
MTPVHVATRAFYSGEAVAATRATFGSADADGFERVMISAQDRRRRVHSGGMRLRELDVVRVCRLFTSTRRIDGTPTVLRLPMIGDIGTIVHVLSEDAFTVECVDADGLTVWLADFTGGELEVVPELPDASTPVSLGTGL